MVNDLKQFIDTSRSKLKMRCPGKHIYGPDLELFTNVYEENVEYDFSLPLSVKV